MAAAEEVQFSLRVTMIKESSKVLYAEVDSDFADVLLSFLTLPLGTIVRLLIKHYGNDPPILGSLSSLYAGLVNLDSRYFWTEEGKLMLLNPRNSSGDLCSRLKLRTDDTPPIQYFTCQFQNCVSLYYRMRCHCSYSVATCKTNDIVEVESDQIGDEGVFTEKTSSFILTDDLEIMTNTPESIFRCLKLNGINDTKLLEERTLVVGSKEIMELLKTSLLYRTPITDVVLPTRSRAATLHEIVKFTASPRTQNCPSITSSDIPKKIFSVKAYVQKSAGRILLIQARHDFVDFLISFLIIPLGRVHFLLENKPCLGSIQNLYRAISSSEILEYMKSSITTLLQPQIPPHYLSLHQIFSLSQQTSPPFRRWFKRTGKKTIFVSRSEPPHSCEVHLEMIDPKSGDSFVKGPALFVVTDDLVVSAAGSTSIVSILKHMNIPLSDIEEQEHVIGLDEALCILQASLTSTSALTDGLKPFLKTQVKQEK